MLSSLESNAHAGERADHPRAKAVRYGNDENGELKAGAADGRKYMRGSEREELAGDKGKEEELTKDKVEGGEASGARSKEPEECEGENQDALQEEEEDQEEDDGEEDGAEVDMEGDDDDDDEDGSDGTEGEDDDDEEDGADIGMEEDDDDNDDYGDDENLDDSYGNEAEQLILSLLSGEEQEQATPHGVFDSQAHQPHALA